MDEKKFYEFYRGKQVGVETRWISNSGNPSSDSYGLSYPIRRDGIIYINESSALIMMVFIP